jgi:hypothetical protein
MSKSQERGGSKEQFWQQMVQRWQQSALSVRAFCAQHGLSEPSFYGWRRRFAQRTTEAVPFVPVRVVSEAATSGGAIDSGSAVELVLGKGRRLRIAPGFDAVTLQRLLALLEEGRPC